MPARRQVLETLFEYRGQAKKENKDYVNEVISLYKSRKIEQPASALRIAAKLAGTKAQIPSGLALLEAYKDKDSATGKLTRNSGPLKTYFVKGKVKTHQFFYKRTKVKGERGDKHTKDYYPEYTFTERIKARNPAEATRKYKAMAHMGFDYDQYEKESKITNVSVDSVSEEPNHDVQNPANQLMRRAKPTKYHFIPSDDKYDQNEGFCVFDVFLGQYAKEVNEELENDKDTQKRIKKLTKETMVQLLSEFYLNDHPYKKMNPLDFGIDGIEEEFKWKPEDGVSPKGVEYLCKNFNISHYAYDMKNRCFMKWITPQRNHRALIYYCIGEHMYWVSDKEAAKSLVMQARDVDVNRSSNMIEDDTKEEKDNVYKDRTIYENIPIEDLKDEKYKDCIIIYSPSYKSQHESKHNLNDELDKIIEVYNIVPKVKNQKYDITSISITPKKYGNKDPFLAQNILLEMDPNDTRLITYKDVMKLCLKHDVPFTNQSFGTFIKQVRTKFYNLKSVRRQLTQQERAAIHEACGGQCTECHKNIQTKHMHIDHIIPLACGGTNDDENLQVLCKKCHVDKSSEEKEQGYVKVSETESSFNLKAHEIFNSTLCCSYAFVERLVDVLWAQRFRHKKIYHLDVNKCRANQLYYSDYDFPLFTVMDEPVIFKGNTARPGLYYVETKAYFPLRGNGWYSQPIIDYCLTKSIIQPTEIKYVIYSGLTIKKDYFNPFIDYMRKNMKLEDCDLAKLAINSMIGCFKPKEREHWKTVAITESINDAMTCYLEADGCFIDDRMIGEKQFYQVYEKYNSVKDATEAPIYNMILDMEAVELHKLSTLIESKRGQLLDLCTDCVSCAFDVEDEELPFEREADGVNIKGYYYDEEGKYPRYKLETKEHDRLRVPKMEQYTRTETYTHEEAKWEVSEDAGDNDFKKYVDMLLKTEKSWHVDGRAGTGKSTLIKLLQAEMKKRNINYEALAPTNKACRIINGKTIHRFALSCGKVSYLDRMDLQYIFVDEISMVPELFYKFFISIKRLRPNIKFIIAGDFEQLLPVNDRVEGCDYKNSTALNELCDGNRLQLLKCRRSDDRLFNMLLKHNIHKIRQTDFKSEFTERHVCYTNAKRKEVNKIMMETYAKKASRNKTQMLELEAHPHSENSQDVKLTAGTPLIGRKNVRDQDLFNNEMWMITKINKKSETITIKEDVKEEGENPIRTKEIPFKLVQEWFNPAWCITIHKSQGSTFDDHPYTVHEFNKLDDRLKYVALSRATDIKHIRVF